MKKDNGELAELFIPVLQANGIEASKDKVVTVVGLMKDRVSFVKDLWETCKFFFVAPTEYDEKTRKKRWKEDSPTHMLELADFLEALEDFSVENQEKAVMAWIAEKGYHCTILVTKEIAENVFFNKHQNVQIVSLNDYITEHKNSSAVKRLLQKNDLKIRFFKFFRNFCGILFTIADECAIIGA